MTKDGVRRTKAILVSNIGFILLVDVYLGYELYYRKVMMNTTYDKESVVFTEPR